MEHINALCSDVPESVFPGSRDVYAVATASVAAFVVNDIYNGQVGVQKYQLIVPLVVLCVPFIFALILRFYYRATDEMKLSPTGIKVADSCGTKQNSPGEIGIVAINVSPKSKSKVIRTRELANSESPLHLPSVDPRDHGQPS